MPLNLSTPATVTPAITATAFNITSFGVNVRDGIMDVTYYSGNFDNSTPPVFTPIGEPRNIHLEGATFGAMLAANPTLYPSLKAILYGLVMTHEGVSGTVV